MREDLDQAPNAWESSPAGSSMCSRRQWLAASSDSVHPPRVIFEERIWHLEFMATTIQLVMQGTRRGSQFGGAGRVKTSKAWEKIWESHFQENF